MAFKEDNLHEWLTNWPDTRAAFWQYRIPNNDTAQDVLTAGYFDGAPLPWHPEASFMRSSRTLMMLKAFLKCCHFSSCRAIAQTAPALLR